MEECVATFSHCLTGQAASLDKTVYEIVRNSILKHLLAYGAMTTEQLGVLVKNHLKYKYYCSLWECYETVRQDLEMRGELRLVSGTEPQIIEIAM